MRFSLTRMIRPASGRPMTCGEVGKLLQRYLDGTLAGRRAARLSAHLEDCRRCGLEADTYELIKKALADSRGQVPSESLARLRAFGERIARGDEPAER